MPRDRYRIGQIPRSYEIQATADLDSAGYAEMSEPVQQDQATVKRLSSKILASLKLAVLAPASIARDIRSFADVNEGVNIGVYMRNHPEEFKHLRDSTESSAKPTQTQ